MQTKTYFASSVPAALEVARQELGAEALLVSSQPTPPHTRQFGRLEVTFAWDSQTSPVPHTGKTPRSPAASQADDIGQRLIGNGFSLEMALEIADAVGNPGDPGAAVIHELIRRIPTVAPLGMSSGESRTVAFVGPPGRGKTSSLVKFAMKRGLSRGIPVRIYTAGAPCIGAEEQMARFAGILGATSWQRCESPASLALAFNGDGGKGLVLIDTPGISPADLKEMGELSHFFATRPDIEKHLVLRADATSADMLHMVSHFSKLAPSRLLFTGLDEAVSAVPMIETLLRSGIPAALVGTGQRIPEALEEFNAGCLARSAWAGGSTSSIVKQARFALAAA